MAPDPEELSQHLEMFLSSSLPTVTKADIKSVDVLKSIATDKQYGDLIVVEAGCIPTGDWVAELQSVALSDTIIATASATSIPPTSTDSGNDAVSEYLLEMCVPSAIYIRRQCLQLVDGFTNEAATCQEALRFLVRETTRRGLIHVLAKSAIVFYGAGTAEWGYPWYGTDVLADDQHVVHHATTGGELHPQRMRVLVDGRRLDAPTTGTQLHILELARSLAAEPDVEVSLVAPTNIHPEAQSFLENTSAVSLVSEAEALNVDAEIFHRPFQVAFADELEWAHRAGKRLVITHQDLIGYCIPDYYPSRADWLGYRDLTKRALSSADGVLTFSEHTAKLIVEEGLSIPERTWGVPLGVDHQVSAFAQQAERPSGLNENDHDLLVCLGNDFCHKNRLFALRIGLELRTKYGWDGMLVLAGPHAAHGSSWDGETQWLDSNPDASDWVRRIGEVQSSEKRWLFEKAKAILYPTVVEGFGLIPFEACDYDVPCIFAPTASLVELFSIDAFTITPWCTEDSAARTAEILRSETARQANVNAIKKAGQALTWARTAKRVVAAYEEILAAKPVWRMT
jgi:glycosyltransferase involved in cell wall biosynthesis